MATPTPSEKPGKDDSDVVLASGNNTEAQIAHIDAVATAPETTLESFAHLDEKKILRKVSRLPLFMPIAGMIRVITDTI